IAGATGTLLSLTNVQLAHAGSYSVVVTNLYGTTTSANAALTVIAGPPCANPPSNLLGWWSGQFTSNNSIGTNHGILQGGTTYGAGKVGQAFSFDGIDDFVQIPKAPNLDIGSQVTIEFWLKLDPSNP